MNDWNRHVQIAIEHKDVAALAVKAANIDFPAWSPTRQHNMLLDGKLRGQAKQLQNSGHTIIEQNIGLAGTDKVSNMNIQRRSPAVDRRGGIVQTDNLRERTISCKPEAGSILGETSWWIRQFENIQATRLPVI